MRIVVRVSAGQLNVFEASCSLEGFQTKVQADQRHDALAGVRRLVFAHFGTLEQPPRCVEFDVVDGNVEVL